MTLHLSCQWSPLEVPLMLRLNNRKSWRTLWILDAHGILLKVYEEKWKREALKLSLLAFLIEVNKFSKSSRHPESSARAKREWNIQDKPWKQQQQQQKMNDGETVIDFINILLFPMGIIHNLSTINSWKFRALRFFFLSGLTLYSEK